MTTRPLHPGIRPAGRGLDCVIDRSADQAQARGPGDEAVEVFAELIEAVRRQDFRTATRCRRRLYALGWSVIQAATGGGR